MLHLPDQVTSSRGILLGIDTIPAVSRELLLYEKRAPSVVSATLLPKMQIKGAEEH
jgi:hypothetical protein